MHHSRAGTYLIAILGAVTLCAAAYVAAWHLKQAREQQEREKEAKAAWLTDKLMAQLSKEQRPADPKLAKAAMAQPGTGYAALATVHDVLQNSPALRLWDDLESNAKPVPTPVKAKAMRETEGAFALLHSSLQGPIRTPSSREWYSQGQYSDLVNEQEIARQLSYRQEFLADSGRADESIEAFADHVKLGRKLSQASIMQCMAGATMQDGATRYLFWNLAKLNADQDERVVREVKALLALRPDYGSAAAGWTQEYVDGVTNAESEGATGAKKWDEFSKDEGDKIRREAHERAEWARRNPDEVRKTLDYVRVLHDAWAREGKKPRWIRVIPNIRPPLDNDIVREAASGLRTCWDVLDRCDEADTRLKLAGVHAAIARYRLQHHALPHSLQDLGLGELVTDPFTGTPLVYRPGAAGYVLYSVGPNGKDDGGRDRRGGGDDIRLVPRR